MKATKRDTSYQKALKKARLQMERAASQAGAKALKSRQNKFLSFDDAEVVPFSSGPTGQVVISVIQTEESGVSLESLLVQETEELQETAMREFTDEMKGVF